MILSCCITLALAAAILAAEVLHARRARRVAGLVFGRSSRPTWLARASPAVRVLAVAGLTWGIATLLMLPGERSGRAGTDDAAAVDPATLKRVVLLVDVSPSMDIKDADGNRSTRGDRAAAVVLDAMSRFSFDQSRLSVLIFYTGVRPVVLDTVDPNVVRHIVWNDNFNMALTDGDTDLTGAVRGAFDVMKDWRPGSATLVVLTDGDSASRQTLPRPPPAIERSIVVGVGDVNRGSEIAGHLSRQDAGNLRQLADRLGGVYFNANAAMLPADLLADVTGPIADAQEPPAPLLRSAATIAIASGSIGLLGLPIGLSSFGRVPRRPLAEARAVRRGMGAAS